MLLRALLVFITMVQVAWLLS